jgi:hypothetical protein
MSCYFERRHPATGGASIAGHPASDAGHPASGAGHPAIDAGHPASEGMNHDMKKIVTYFACSSNRNRKVFCKCKSVGDVLQFCTSCKFQINQ